MKKLSVLIFMLFFAYFAYAENIQTDSINPSGSNTLTLAGNINLSIAGNILFSSTDEEDSADKGRTVMNLGEMEIMFDADLNPYAKGNLTLNFAQEDVDGEMESIAEVEEAYITFYRNLPIDRFSLKTGKYRAGFGRINQTHPHVLPFIEAPRIIGQFLPGEEGYIDTGVDAAYMFEAINGAASIVSFDVLTGKEFHPDTDTGSDYAYLARLNNSFLIGGSPVEIGIDAMQSASSVIDKRTSYLYGADLKSKLNFSPQTSLTLMGEFFMSRGSITEMDTSAEPHVVGDYLDNDRYGFYAMANANFGKRWNLGAIYDSYQRQGDSEKKDFAVKAFGGFSLLEETTVIRLSFERYFPEDEAPVNTAMLQLVFTMGPHKTHKF